MIKFVANENIGYEIVQYLEKQGFKVYSILGELRGLTDEEIAGRAFREKAIIITSDKDFGELIFKKKLQSWGVILLRPQVETFTHQIQALERVFKRFKDESLLGKFVVANETKVRVRKIKKIAPCAQNG